MYVLVVCEAPVRSPGAFDMAMTRIADVVKNNDIYSRGNSKGNSRTRTDEIEELDELLIECDDLIDNERYRPWFRKRFDEIGGARIVRRLARLARDKGKQCGRFFVYLLKNYEAVEKVNAAVARVTDRISFKKPVRGFLCGLVRRLKPGTIDRLMGTALEVGDSPGGLFLYLARQELTAARRRETDPGISPL